MMRPAIPSGTAQQMFPRGMDVVGHYHLIGGSPRDILLIAEGYATAASLHEATGLPVAVAFNAGNLLPADRSLRSMPVPDLALAKAVAMGFHTGRLEHDPRLYLLAKIIFDAGECALLCDAIAAQPRDDADVVAMMDRAFAFRCQQQDASDALARLTAGRSPGGR